MYFVYISTRSSFIPYVLSSFSMYFVYISTRSSFILYILTRFSSLSYRLLCLGQLFKLRVFFINRYLGHTTFGDPLHLSLYVNKRWLLNQQVRLAKMRCPNKRPSTSCRYTCQSTCR